MTTINNAVPNAYARLVNSLRAVEQQSASFTGANLITVRSQLITIGQNVSALAVDLVEAGYNDMRALLALDHMALHHDIELAMMVMTWQLRNAIDAHTDI